jgi:integrase
MTRRITDLGIQSLRPQATRYERPAGGGLYVQVMPTGRKRFTVRYRFAGKTRKLTLQSGITLAAARKIAADALFQLEQGIDPATARQQARQEQRLAASDTLQAVTAEYLRRMRREGRLRSIERTARVFEQKILPALGTRPIGAILRSDVIRLLDKVEEDGGPAAADEVFSLLSRLMSWHAPRSDSFRSPLVRGMRRTKTRERARTRALDDDELRRFWETAEADPGPFGPLLQFLLLTGARLNEAAQMRWSEVSGDIWVLPAVRNKVKQDLARPLTTMALAALARAPRIAGSDYVFTVDGRTAIGGISRRKSAFDAKSGITAAWRTHDIRRSCRTLLSRANVDADTAERCLGHVLGGVRATYDRHAYIQQMRRAYESLATLIQHVVNPTNNVALLRSVPQ